MIPVWFICDCLSWVWKTWKGSSRLQPLLMTWVPACGWGHSAIQLKRTRASQGRLWRHCDMLWHAVTCCDPRSKLTKSSDSELWPVQKSKDILPAATSKHVQCHPMSSPKERDSPCSTYFNTVQHFLIFLPSKKAGQIWSPGERVWTCLEENGATDCKLGNQFTHQFITKWHAMALQTRLRRDCTLCLDCNFGSFGKPGRKGWTCRTCRTNALNTPNTQKHPKTSKHMQPQYPSSKEWFKERFKVHRPFWAPAHLHSCSLFRFKHLSIEIVMGVSSQLFRQVSQSYEVVSNDGMSANKIVLDQPAKETYSNKRPNSRHLEICTLWHKPCKNHNCFSTVARLAAWSACSGVCSWVDGPDKHFFKPNCGCSACLVFHLQFSHGLGKSYLQVLYNIVDRINFRMFSMTSVVVSRWVLLFNCKAQES